jgi:hypothetical protein
VRKKNGRDKNKNRALCEKNEKTFVIITCYMRRWEWSVLFFNRNSQLRQADAQGPACPSKSPQSCRLSSPPSTPCLNKAMVNCILKGGITRQFCVGLRIRISIGSGSRMAKMTHKSRKIFNSLWRPRDR